eukprot:9298699-Pyramimonas_sp.AAC.1
MGSPNPPRTPWALPRRWARTPLGSGFGHVWRAWHGLGRAPRGLRLHCDWRSKALFGSQSCRVVLGMGRGVNRCCLQIAQHWVRENELVEPERGLQWAVLELF